MGELICDLRAGGFNGLCRTCGQDEGPCCTGGATPCVEDPADPGGRVCLDGTCHSFCGQSGEMCCFGAEPCVSGSACDGMNCS
jgi:hypothetical protein